jgi:hypothetical protein
MKMLKKFRSMLAAALVAALSLSSLPASATTYSWMNFTINANGSGMGSYMLSAVGDLVWTPTAGVTVSACSTTGSFLVLAADGGVQFYGLLVAARLEAMARGAAITVSAWVPDDICKYTYPTFYTIQVNGG